MNELYKILVGAIPVYDGHVLVLQRSEREKFMPGAWGLPSGKINFGEELKVAVLRELKEEAGIGGSVGKLVGYSSFMSEKDGIKLHNLQVNFLVYATSDQVILDGSSQDFQWIPLNAVDSDARIDKFTADTIKQAW